MRAIKGELDAYVGRVVSYDEWAIYAGQTKGSVFEKFQRTQQVQVEALLRWLERLPEPTRNRLVNAACRVFPTISSPRIAHDPTQVSHLQALLRQESGFSLIQGGTDGVRTFLATALGHSETMLRLEPRDVYGLDVHEPNWFVPVGKVVYLNNMLNPVTLRENFHRYWPELSRIKGNLVILNGVWPAVQGLEDEVAELAANAHVLVADDPRFKIEAVARRAPGPVHSLTVSEEKESRIRVVLNQLQAPFTST